MTDFSDREPDNDHDLLLLAAEEGVSWVHAKGYQWFWQRFVPTLRTVAAEQSIAPASIADAYYVAGDVHDFNEAPLAAISCYREALRFDAAMGPAHREIASMLGQLGRYSEALQHIDKAIALNPDDQNAIKDRSDYLEEDGLYALYTENSPTHRANEALAQAKPEEAITLIGEPSRSDEKIAAIRCYGALQDAENYIAAWTNLLATELEVELSHADWFFMPEAVYEDFRLWDAFEKSSVKFNGVCLTYESLEISNAYRELSTDQKLRVVISFLRAASARGEAGLSELADRFPDWHEVSEEGRSSVC